MITTMVVYSTTRKTLVRKMFTRLRNKFPGMFLPERQSAQLVLFRINHTKSEEFKASGGHRKQDKMSMFSHNKIIECPPVGRALGASARRWPDRLLSIVHLFHWNCSTFPSQK